MKLVIATPLYPPEAGGPATYAKILEEELPKRGWEVSVVKFSDVRHLPKFIRHIAYFRNVLKAARDADVVLALDPVSVGFPAMKAAQKAGKKFVLKIVGDYAWEQGSQRFGVTENLDEFVRTSQKSFFVRRLQKIQTHVAKNAIQIIVPSEYLKKIVTQWGIPSEKITVVHNAVSVEKIGEAPEAVKNLPHPLVVSVGRLVPWKGMDSLIEAVSRVPEMSLAIVGDGPERKNLEQKAKEILKDRCVFTGQLTHEDTLATLSAGDIFVLNSSYEGLSHVLIEARMLGVATIVTNAGGNAEVVTGGTGLIIPSGDNMKLEEAISLLTTDEAKRKELGRLGQEDAKRFSVDAMISKTTETLKHL